MRLLTELLPWQQRAVDKLLPMRIGALYMEMGTGKTRTALEMIARRLDEGKISKALWLCPCSVIHTIQADFCKHAEGAQDVIRVRGIESLSCSLRLYKQLRSYCMDGDVMLVVDESDLVKNYQTVRSERVTDIAAVCKYRVILNGTPISKNEADLFSQWYILDWRVLGYKRYWSFAQNHLEYDSLVPSKIRRTLNVDYLVSKIAPYSYHVSRAECFSLPPKEQASCYYWLDSQQSQHYSEVANALLMDLDELKTATIYRLFTGLQHVISGRTVTVGEHLTTVAAYDTPMDNPRIRCLASLLDDIGTEKTLIFAKYTHEIQTILDVIHSRGATGVPFYGEVPQKQRKEMLAAFAEDAQYMVCNKTCAGYGLNLQFCHNIIYYSNDWDYATRIQSEDRVHRLGQENKVMIYDIIARETLDERICACLDRKQGLMETLKNELSRANNIKEHAVRWVYGKA